MARLEVHSVSFDDRSYERVLGKRTALVRLAPLPLPWKQAAPEQVVERPALAANPLLLALEAPTSPLANSLQACFRLAKASACCRTSSSKQLCQMKMTRLRNVGAQTASHYTMETYCALPLGPSSF